MENALKKLQSTLAPGEGYRIDSPANRLYLTGFESSDGVILISHESAALFVDFRYYEMACHKVTDMEVILYQSGAAQIEAFCRERQIQSLYPETRFLSVAAYRRLCRELPSLALSDSDRLDELLLQQRMIKTEGEIEKIRRAQAITDETFTYILERIEPGRKEKDIMLDMEFFMRRYGSLGVAFDLIVVSGKNSSLPHGVPGERQIQKGDFVTMDFGAVVDGYRSDMTRTVAVGSVSEEQKAVYACVLSAQQAALCAIRPGQSCSSIDAIARNRIDSAGYAGCFGHALGHSVGIEIHESPVFSGRCQTKLAPGMVMTVEPGIYLANRFGVRIEDMVVVTEGGCTNLTRSPKELILL